MDLQAREKVWLARARIGGRQVRLAADQLPRVRRGWDSQRSSADTTHLDVPIAYQGGEEALIDVGWNGELVRMATMLVDSPSSASPSLSRQVKHVDLLGKLRKAVSIEINWRGRTCMDACFDLLIQAGIPQVSHVDDPGFLLGAEQTISIKVGEKISTVFQELMDFMGTVAWVGPDGDIRIEFAEPVPSGSYANNTVYAFGASGGELGMLGSSWTLGSPERLVSSVYVTGPPLASGITPTGAAVLPSVEGEPWSRQYRFLQTGTVAQAIAQRELRRRAVNRRTIQWRAPFNPFLLPGMTVGYRDETNGVRSTEPVRVWAVEGELPEMVVTAYAGANVVDGVNPLQAPVPLVTVTIDFESVIVAGVSVGRYFVQCDASQSYDPDGTVQTYQWTATGATPSSATGARAVFVFETLTGKRVSLTITDNHGQQATKTIPLDAGTIVVVTRTISIAEGSAGWCVIPDGTTPRVFTRAGRSCTSVPSFNEHGPLLSGWDDGAVFRQVPELTAPPVQIGTALAGGAVNALFVNETDTSILAGVGAKLYRSTDYASWQLLTTFPTSVNDAQSSPANAREMAVATGNTAQRSFDAGATWTTYITGLSGSIARCLASAPWGHACVFTGVGQTPADAVTFEEGATVNWSGVSAPPAELLSITPLLTTEGFIVGDLDAKHYLLLKSGNSYTASSIGALPAPAAATSNINDQIRDGQLSGLSYSATEAGTYKLVNQTTLYQLRTQPSLQIGYGKLGVFDTPPTAGTADILVPTFGASPGGVWNYRTGQLLNSGLPAGAFWRALAADPHNADRWLLLGTITQHVSGTFRQADGSHALWLTTNAGASWSAVPLPGQAAGEPNVQGLTWSQSTPGDWAVMGTLRTADHYGAIWRGSLGTAQSVIIVPPWERPQRGVSPGQDNDMVFHDGGTSGGDDTGRLGYHAAGSATFTQSGAKFTEGTMYVETAPGLADRTVLATGTPGLYIASDYRTSGFSVASGTSAVAGLHTIARTANGAAYFGDFTDGLRKMANPLSSPASITAIPVPLRSGETSIATIRADRQGRTRIAVRIQGSHDCFVLSATDDRVERVPAPAGTAGMTLSGAVEIITSGGTPGSTAPTSPSTAPPVITSATTASGTTSSPLSYTITATNSPTRFGASGLPPGLTTNLDTGLISGTPTAAGSFSATVAAFNGGGSGEQRVTITIT